ncbi:MAG TPA: protein phosphatase 2C domain-containing protein [Nocardioides sp.]|uniref:PP2C family protein-serine/threonine phosphatase n=1 Tax=Nocardioides sp. TaxID=35761 RepID=UPI002E31316C|nr:protein phosphatase 2C domain-containing protein [Nocardioides sp.]HEX3929612.1 protein phosphatase 2C domain-containing protein [Nocardioides sp.]
MSFRLQYAAISDVGRVRKDNQDAGYAGPWLLTVCDGVGGAARGDLASSTAITQLRRLDEPPSDDHDAADTAEHRLELVAGALHRASDKIGDLVDEEPSLSGTSTTATVALFDGERLAMGHVGDSRAYLFRDREISQLTSDHTFVQSLIDEGRITEADARTHPHRNLILKALDGVHEVDPDLFTVQLAESDRILLCSDGASGSLDNRRLADILSTGSPDFAAVELVRASLEAGSTDNVTCIVADVLPVSAEETADEPTPMVVGSAAELRRRPRAGASFFRGHRAGDTGEMEPIAADLVDELPPGVPFAIDTDPEAARYAPRPPRRHPWLRRGLALLGLLGIAWMAGAAAWTWSQHQYYVGEQHGVVTVFRGVQADVPGLSLSHAYETSNVRVGQLDPYTARTVESGIGVGSLGEAERTVQRLATSQSAPTSGGQ